MRGILGNILNLNKIKGWAAGLGVVLLALVAAFAKGRKEGGEVAEAEAYKEIIDDVQTAKEVRTRVDTDVKYRNRVRDKFTR